MGKHSGTPANENSNNNLNVTQNQDGSYQVNGPVQDLPVDNQVMKDVFLIDRAYGDY